MLFSDRQLVGLVVLGGLIAWGVQRQAKKLAVSAGDAVEDSLWWYGHKAEQGYGSALALGWDDFDKKHRPYYLTDERSKKYSQYKRWKEAVLSGQLPEPPPLER